MDMYDAVEGKPFRLEIYLVLGPHNIVVDKQFDCSKAEDAEKIWERDFRTTRYGAIYSRESGKQIKALQPL